MRNNPAWWIFVGVILGVLLTIVAVVLTGGATSALYWQRAAAAERQARMAELEAELQAAEAHEQLLDADRRAAENAKPQPEEAKGFTVVINLKNAADGLVIEVGDGTTMRLQKRQELPDYLRTMRRDRMKEVELRVDADAEWKSVSDIIEEAQKAGFEKITLQKREKK